MKIIYFFLSLFFLVFGFCERGNLLGLGRRSTMVGVETGVFFCALAALAAVAAATAGTALPERACRFGEPSEVLVGPTDWDRATKKKW